MSEELKPCPFCGGEASIRHFAFHSGAKYHVVCESCLCSVSYEWTPEEAAEAWNTRAKEQTMKVIYRDGAKVVD